MPGVVDPLNGCELGYCIPVMMCVVVVEDVATSRRHGSPRLSVLRVQVAESLSWDPGDDICPPAGAGLSYHKRSVEGREEHRGAIHLELFEPNS